MLFTYWQQQSCSIPTTIANSLPTTIELKYARTLGFGMPSLPAASLMTFPAMIILFSEPRPPGSAWYAWLCPLMITKEWRLAIRSAAAAESWLVELEENQWTGSVFHENPDGLGSIETDPRANKKRNGESTAIRNPYS